MPKQNHYTPYLTSLFFFKLAVGATLLATSWDTLSFSENKLLNVAIMMALSFLPAAFARPLFNFCKFNLQKLLVVGFGSSAIFILLVGRTLITNIEIAFILNFILWIAIFLVEVSLEKWYVTLSQNPDPQAIRKLSGISTSIAQIGIILGPGLVIITEGFGHMVPYFFITMSFLLAAISPLRTNLKNKAQTNSKIFGKIM